jgi:hypothetical protein
MEELDVDERVATVREFFAREPRTFAELKAMLPDRDPSALAYAVRRTSRSKFLSHEFYSIFARSCTTRTSVSRSRRAASTASRCPSPPSWTRCSCL